MTEYIGTIAIPEITPSGTFPCVPDYGYGYAQNPSVVIHQFGSGNAKIEQRFYQGASAKRFTVRRAMLTEPERIDLRDFWEGLSGPYGTFTYNAPNDSGVGTTAYTVRFANEPLSWEMLEDYISSVGVTLIEVPTTDPSFVVESTYSRFPSSELLTALLSQTQEIIPLIKIQPREVGYDAIYLSDRRCTVDSVLYQPRLVDWDGISQGVGGEADQASFTFGNADRVMRDLANDTNLTRAAIEFSLYHVGSEILVNLWKGEITSWDLNDGPEFRVQASDGIYELTLPYPCRRVSRTCWKKYDDGNGCPYTDHSTGLDTTHFASASAGSCDKGYDTANGCLAHGMKHYFGGILARPQTIGLISAINGVIRSILSKSGPGANSSNSPDSLYESIMAEVYCNNPSYVDTDSVTKYGMPVPCLLATGRDEGDKYQALGVIGEGPLTLGSGHTLDGMTAVTGGSRAVLGEDPAGASDYFSLSQDGDNTGGNWRKVYTGGKTYDDNFAAGTAALILKREDDAGLQLTRADNHQMTAMVTYGLSGWVWTAANTRTWVTLTNPIWIVVNMLLKAKGLRYASATTAEGYFDLDAAIAAAAICSTTVAKLVGTGNETQFTFQGVIGAEKPLRDWITDVLMNCLGYYTFAFGKLKVGVRSNSSAVEAFTTGNILFRSLQLKPNTPSFNFLTGYHNEQEYKFVRNSVDIKDEDHAALIGGAAAPLYIKSDIELLGTSTKSQNARIITTRLREELGGVSAAQWRDAREISFRTTILALNIEPGMVCSLTHDDMPSGAGEFRVLGWKLNKDYSIDIQGKTTHDDMYDLTVGPKPADVVADPVPVESLIVESPWAVLYSGVSAEEAVAIAEAAAAAAAAAEAAAAEAQGTANDAAAAAAAAEETAAAALAQVPDRLSAMPTTGNTQGRMVFLTANDGIYLANHLYRYTGTGWTEEVNATAIVGQLLAAQIAAGEIYTHHLRVVPQGINPDPYFKDSNLWTMAVPGTWEFKTAAQSATIDAMGVASGVTITDYPGTGNSVIYTQIPLSGAGQTVQFHARFNNPSSVQAIAIVSFYNRSGAYVSGGFTEYIAADSHITTLNKQVAIPVGATVLEIDLGILGANTGTPIGISEVKVNYAADADLIVDGAIDGKTITGAIVQTEATAARGVKLTSAGIDGYNASGVKTIEVNASTGAVAITGALTAGAGSSLPTTYLDGVITPSQVNLSSRGWVQTCVFSITDNNTVEWGAGTLTAADGTAYSIDAGNTGNMSAKTYIYLDIAVSTTAYQVTTTPTTAIGSGKVLVGVAQNGTVEPTFAILSEQGGKNLDAASLVAGSITANEIGADQVTADKLYVTDLAAINATLGTVTSGVITGSTFRTTADGDGNYIEISGQTIKGLDTDDAVIWEMNPKDGFMALVDLADSSFAKAINNTNVMADHYWDELATANTTEDRLAKQATVLASFKATAWDVTGLFTTLPRAYLISVNATIPAAGKFVPCISPVTITAGTYTEVDPVNDPGVYSWRFQFTRSVNPYTIMGAPTGGGSITVEQLMIVYPTRLDDHNYIYLTSDVSVSGISGNIRILSAIQ
jgi:hypothetical protein